MVELAYTAGLKLVTFGYVGSNPTLGTTKFTKENRKKKSMGFKIWRKDREGWFLAFDIVFPTREKALERIAELNAAHKDLVKFGELEFLPYPEDIKIDKKGDIIDDKLPIYRQKSKRRQSNYKLVYR
jgi:hypothetical protein